MDYKEILINSLDSSDSEDDTHKSHIQQLNRVEQSIIKCFLNQKTPEVQNNNQIDTKSMKQKRKIKKKVLDSSDESDVEKIEDKSDCKESSNKSIKYKAILDSDESDTDSKKSDKLSRNTSPCADLSKKSTNNKPGILDSSDESDTDSKKSGKLSRNTSPCSDRPCADTTDKSSLKEKCLKSKLKILDTDESDVDDKVENLDVNKSDLWADSSKKSTINKSRSLDSSDESDTDSNKNRSRNTSPERNFENDGISRPDLWADSPEKSYLKENHSAKKSKNRSKTDPGEENALEGIRSETQRLVRESRVSLPYHKPKQRTLADFLNRRNATPGISLHTTSDKMTKVLKEIEEREKEAECFYKSESEDECDSTINIDKTEITTEIEEKEETKEPEYVSSGYTQNLSELVLHLNDTEMASEIENILDINKPCLSHKTQNSEIKFSDSTLNTIPKLSGAPHELVDLDVITPKHGVTGLLKRFIKHAGFIKKPVSTDETILEIVSSEINEKQEIVNVTQEKIKVKSSENPKPGESLVKLKATLQQKMANIREEMLAKKQEEMKLYENEFYEGEKEVCDDEKDEDFDEESEGSSTSDEETDDEKLNDDENEKEMLFADNEAQESDCSEDTQDSDQSDSDESQKSKSKILDETIVNYGSEDIFSSGNLQSENISKAPDTIEELVKGSIESNKDIFGQDTTTDDSPENLLSFCSGKFPSQSINLVDLEKTQLNDEIISDDHVTSSNIELDDDSDDDFLLPKIKKKCKKLTFSDDEDDTKDEEIIDDGDKSDDEEIEEEEDIENNFPDDEETLLAKKLSKGFLDGEAELSGSEWDSADEDERDLDKFEEEEGDADHISNRKLQKELGKIHMKELLADDKREIRVLKELLLEDGDLHSDGPKRQRLFRWANQDDDNFDQTLCQDDDQMDENDIEDEESWRKQRIERENFLKQKKIDNLSIEFDENELSLSINRSVKKPQTPQMMTVSPDPKAKFKLMTSRSSFLTRGEKILSKIANTTSNKADNTLNNNLRGRNMIFTAVSPSKEDSKNNREKRKAECSQMPTQKKIKLTPSTKPSIFDKLKMSD